MHSSFLKGNGVKMAESKGFEPLNQFYPVARFPSECFRPLSQLSAHHKIINNKAPNVNQQPQTAGVGRIGGGNPEIL